LKGKFLQNHLHRRTKFSGPGEGGNSSAQTITLRISGMLTQIMIKRQHT
jgi:hypothetical protein